MTRFGKCVTTTGKPCRPFGEDGWCNNDGMPGLIKATKRKTRRYAYKGTPVMSDAAKEAAAFCAGTLKQAQRMPCIIGSQNGPLWGIEEGDQWTKLASDLVGETLLHSGSLILDFEHRLRDIELANPTTDWFHFGDSKKATGLIGQCVADGASAVHLLETVLRVRKSPSWRSNLPRFLGPTILVTFPQRNCKPSSTSESK
jgi:hypothetical protein